MTKIKNNKYEVQISKTWTVFTSIYEWTSSNNYILYINDFKIIINGEEKIFVSNLIKKPIKNLKNEDFILINNIFTKITKIDIINKNYIYYNIENIKSLNKFKRHWIFI